MQRLMTAEQAAAYWQVSTQTIRNWEKSGKIKAQRVGIGTVRYLVDDAPSKEQRNDKAN